MYFVVLWKNKDLSLHELDLLQPKWIKVFKEIAEIDEIWKPLFHQLWWIIKYGRILDLESIYDELETVDIIGTNNKELWISLKKNWFVRRFKEVELTKTDKEIKEKWKEIIYLTNDKFWIVDGYQNIWVYETIDFGKPSSGMTIGMMPSKLAHIMINVWINTLSLDWPVDNITVYDPFTGFGTTWFLANYFGYNFIGSDINITTFKPNLKWWKEQSYYKPDYKMHEFKHDVNNSFEKNILKYVNLIVTEWWLWPVVKERTTTNELLNYKYRIQELYTNFLKNAYNFWDKITIVITIPVYLKSEIDTVHSILDEAEKIWFMTEMVGQVYERKKQNVWRQVVVFQK